MTALGFNLCSNFCCRTSALFFCVSIRSLLKKLKAVFHLINILVKPQLCQQDNREDGCVSGFRSIVMVDVGEGFFTLADVEKPVRSLKLNIQEC